MSFFKSKENLQDKKWCFFHTIEGETISLSYFKHLSVKFIALTSVTPNREKMRFLLKKFSPSLF